MSPAVHGDRTARGPAVTHFILQVQKIGVVVLVRRLVDDENPGQVVLPHMHVPALQGKLVPWRIPFVICFAFAIAARSCGLGVGLKSPARPLRNPVLPYDAFHSRVLLP